MPSNHARGPGGREDVKAALSRAADHLPEFVKFADAAAYLGCATKTLYDYSYRDLLDDCKVGRGRGTRLRRDRLIELFVSGRIYLRTTNPQDN